MTNKHSVIINADDLGYSSTVNDAIFGLMAERRISSATLLANAPAAEEAATRSKDFPFCSFGAHLCLTEFQPLTKEALALPFVNDEGHFDSRRFAATRPDQCVKKIVYEEWCAQIKWLQSAGVQISHIDSHQHVHTRPWLFPVLKRIQRNFGIRKVRISMNLYYSQEHKPGIFLLLKKIIFNAALRRCYATRTTGFFTNLKWYQLLSTRQNLTGKSAELMVHPGSPGFEEETRLLHSKWFDDFRQSCRLINYNEL